MADLSAGDIFMADLSTAEHLYSSYLNCGALYGSSLPHFFLRLVCRYFWRCFILSFESDKLYYILQFLWFERRKIWCYFIVEMGWPSCLRTPIFHRPHLWGDLMAVVLKSAREQVFWNSGGCPVILGNYINLQKIWRQCGTRLQMWWTQF